MTVTLDCTLVVSLRELRQAIASVVMHAEPTKTGDEISKLSRVRITAGQSEMLLAATNTTTTTTALAAVTIDEDSRAERFAADDGVFSVDVLPGALRGLLQTFRVDRPTADAEDAYAEVKLTDSRLTLTDVNALLPGMSTTLPLLDLTDSFPDVVGILSRTFASASASPQAKPLVSEAKPLALFRHAATAYSQPLTFEATGTVESRGWAVWCGPQFSGLISSTDPSGNSLGRRDQDRHAHFTRLGIADNVRRIS